jgi:hypothetical protein
MEFRKCNTDTFERVGEKDLARSAGAPQKKRSSGIPDDLFVFECVSRNAIG